MPVVVVAIAAAVLLAMRVLAVRVRSVVRVRMFDAAVAVAVPFQRLIRQQGPIGHAAKATHGPFQEVSDRGYMIV